MLHSVRLLDTTDSTKIWTKFRGSGQAVIDLILSNNMTVQDALDRLDHRPRNVQTKWEKLTEKFTRFEESEKDRFFDLNEASVTRWVAKRGRR